MEKEQIERELEIYRRHISALTQDIANLYAQESEVIPVEKEITSPCKEEKKSVDELKDCIGELCGLLKDAHAQQSTAAAPFQAVPGMFFSPALPFLKTPDITPVMPARMLNNQNKGETTR